MVTCRSGINTSLRYKATGWQRWKWVGKNSGCIAFDVGGEWVGVRAIIGYSLLQLFDRCYETSRLRWRIRLVSKFLVIGRKNKFLLLGRAIGRKKWASRKTRSPAHILKEGAGMRMRVRIIPNDRILPGLQNSTFLEHEITNKMWLPSS